MAPLPFIGPVVTIHPSNQGAISVDTLLTMLTMLQVLDSALLTMLEIRMIARRCSCHHTISPMHTEFHAILDGLHLANQLRLSNFVWNSSIDCLVIFKTIFSHG